MGPWLVWLARLAASRKFVTWLVKELGPGALDLYKRWITQLRHRQVAIDEADQIDGHFSAAIIDGNRHVVVWKNNQPVSAYPPLKHGDLSEKLRHHTRQDLQDPDELPTRRALRWVTSHVPGIGDHSEPDTKQLVAARDSKFPSGERRFHAAVKRTEPLLDDLQRAVRHCVSDHPVIPAVPGIYLFHYDGKPIYVGQSRNLRRRLSQHTAMGSRQNEASFAFNLAKRSAGEAGLNVVGSRAAVESDPEFAKHFERARRQVAEMDVQFIALEDPIERTLFEVYAALSLGTEEFNSFETH